MLRPELAVVPMLLPHRQVAQLARGMFAKPERLPDEWYDAFADEFLRVFNQPRGRMAFFSAARQVYLEPARGERGFWDRLPQLRTRALFIWGDRDRLVPVKFARHVTEALPQAQSVVLRECGHVPQFERPEATHKHIRQFLARR
jgi:pimeloyl-ACP methyl ester carboxylesterase